jgi:predicted GNAT superfamily acetyltransferase
MASDEPVNTRSIEVRALHTHEEFAQAVALQRLIWKFADLEALPVRLFVTAVNVGGQALGAFDEDRMIGFCLAIPGVKREPSPRPYLHSHMLGVLDEYRDAGVGRLLKLEQRKQALEREIDLIEWTFDPFEVKNAYFNIERLGAIVRRYVRNLYGTTTSPLHGGLPTDRCFAEWYIASDRVQQVLGGQSKRQPPLMRGVQVPAHRSRAAQQLLAEQLTSAFDNGMAVTAFERKGESGTYFLEPWPSK